MRTRIALFSFFCLIFVAAVHPARAQEAFVKKQSFEIPSFTTQNGRVLKNVKVGWESYGSLNADKSNAILICHFFSGTSHAAGKYAAADAAPGYWDAIIGPGKAIDTNKYFVLSVDTLVNLSANDPNVITTGPASLNPDTGKPYGMEFPVVSFRDFVETQKALVDSLGIKKLAMVGGASMGALQTYEWAAAYPQMVTKIMPVIGAAGTDAGLLEWLDIWASPIRLDPKWNNGDYYGKEPPLAGLAESLKIVTMHANHPDWANATFNANGVGKWAKEGEDPAKTMNNRYAVETTLANAGAARAKVSDANHFLYLVRANQLYAAGNGDERIAKIKAPALMIYSPKDMVFQASYVEKTAATLKANGNMVEIVKLEGNRGHLDGVISMKQAEAQISAFLAK